MDSSSGFDVNLSEEIKPYIDSNGLVSGNGQPTGNGIRYTSEWLIANKQITNEDLLFFYQSIMQCVHLGFIYESPDGGDASTIDDLIPLFHARRHVDVIFRHSIYKIYQCLKDHYWIQPTRDGRFQWKGCLFRFPQLICHAKFCFNEKPNIFLKLYWCFVVLLACFNKRSHQDGWILTWHMVKAAQDRSKLCDFVGNIWWEKKEKMWPNGLGECMGEYFQNPNHPLAKYWRD